jgi:group I intron endonuclease
MIIYKITNTINNKIYIGQTIQSLEKRWKRHTWLSTLNRNAMAITNALRKYGVENFKIEIIYTATNIDELNEKEIEFINEYNSLSPNGYNLTSGGKNSPKSEEIKMKISLSTKGKYVSTETRKKLSESHRGFVVSEETKKKLSIINKGKKIDDKVRIASINKCNKCYILFDIVNETIYAIKNMRKFSKLNKHSIGKLCSLSTGKLKKYKNFILIENLGVVNNLNEEVIIDKTKHIDYKNIVYFNL